ncbi:MFS transporter [Burkholderia glumae]|uniref:MFS transporter n=1 Tax=Burkholderia glumae TaxID=337 RepID=A0AAP9XZ11_BURGL|nr:major facilitator superfamily transporter [Burkholderia glumae BGR1]AJY63669.1 major Facilitator Superfamily protein [Burkholderia glumae LMG 2196 = ATCC 33617]MCR1769283.1 MFS transporter [Burkholderia glumae]PJO20966.1 MFS transporter [Burkholderia glumae AU6208]PNL05291.1 MFS transporter [Burkholderia glumae]
MSDKTTTRAAFFLCGFAAFLNLYSTQGILRELAAAFAVSAERAGQGVSATTLAVAIIAPFAGTLSARFARRRVIAWAAIAVALPALGCAHADGFGAFLAARFAAGALVPFIFAISIAYIGELFGPAAATEVGALFVAGTTLGGFAGRFVTNALTALLGWRHALDLVALLCLAAGLAIHAWLPAAAPPPAPGPAAPRPWRLVTRPALLASFALGACVLASQVATFTFVGLRLAGAPFRFTTFGIGAIYAVFLVAVVVTPLAGRMAGRRGPRELALGAAALAVAGALLTLSGQITVILLGLALGSTAVFVEQACANAFVSQAAPAARSTAIGLYLSCYYLGGSLGSLLPIPAWHRWGWAGCIAFVVAAQLLVAVLAARFWRAPRAADTPAAIAHAGPARRGSRATARDFPVARFAPRSIESAVPGSNARDTHAMREAPPRARPFTSEKSTVTMPSSDSCPPAPTGDLSHRTR